MRHKKNEKASAKEWDNNKECNGLYWPGDCRAVTIIYQFLIVLPFLYFVLSIYLFHAHKPSIICHLSLCVELLILTEVRKSWYSTSNRWNVINKNSLEYSWKQGDWRTELTA